MNNTPLGKISGKHTFIILIIAISVVILLLSINLYKDKAFYFMDKKIGFDSTIEKNHENKLQEQKILVSSLKNKIFELEKKIVTLNKRYKKEESPIAKYSLSKLVYPEEKFNNSMAGVKFSMSGVYKAKGEWSIRANLTIPGSGDFTRYILISDTYNFSKDNKKFNLSFSKFNPEDKSIFIQINEI
ncbi:MAG: hypothetical protein QNK36_21975 [Colwellia sp.]|nr:hypothetical protein [Colwellia sp.]